MCPSNNEGTKGQLHSTEECVSINEVLTRVGDKWSLQVISRLGEGRCGSQSSNAPSRASLSACSR